MCEPMKEYLPRAFLLTMARLEYGFSMGHKLNVSVHAEWKVRPHPFIKPISQVGVFLIKLQLRELLPVDHH